jgi:hypothetical protein
MNVYEAVRERDGGMCVLCWLLAHKRLRGTEVHHLLHRSRCVGQWEYLRTAQKNLVLLCHAHHQPQPSRVEAQKLLRYLRDRYGYEYREPPFRELLEENG